MFQSPGSCSEGDYRGQVGAERRARRLGCPLGVVEVAQPRAEMAGGRRWQGAGEVESMIQLHVEEAPTVLACIGSVGAQKGQNRDELSGS